MKSSISPLLLIPLILTAYVIVGAGPSDTGVSGLNLPDAEAAAEYPDSWIFNIGDDVGSVSSSISFTFDSGSPLIISQDSSFPVTIVNQLSQSFVLSPDKSQRLESMEYSINYDIDEALNVVEVSADFIILACPLSEYCDEQGSPSAVILCGDTHNPCDIGFDGASPFVILDLKQWFHKDSPDKLFETAEEIRILAKAEYVSVKLQGKGDGALYSATNNFLMVVADLPTDVNFTPIQNILINLNQGNIQVQDFMDDPVLQVNDVVTLGNGVAGIVDNIRVCSGITNPPQPGQCSAGLCHYTFANDASGATRECP